MFSEYAALVKNLRGVIYLDPSEEIDEHLNWLVNRFRYRIVGVTPSLFDSNPKFFTRKPFVRLVYPIESLEKLTRLVVDVLDIEPAMSEVIVLASSYVCPILALGKKPPNRFKNLSVDRVESRLDLDNRGWKLHLRIADYTVLDLYQWSTEHASLLWEGKTGAEFVETRKKRIVKDKKRYWRLEKGSSQPWTFMFYLDLAGQLAQKLGSEIAEVLKDIDLSARAGLAIEGAVLISL
jgi:hypothetical protein